MPCARRGEQSFPIPEVIPMPTSVRHSVGKLSEEKLAAVEGTWGIRLPDDYRAFLLQHNGGVPRPVECRFPCRPGRQPEAVRLLLARGASVGQWDNDGRLALHHAVQSGNVETM